MLQCYNEKLDQIKLDLSISCQSWTLDFKHCHKSPMTGKGKYITNEYGDDWGMVYSFTHIMVKLKTSNVGFMRIYQKWI